MSSKTQINLNPNCYFCLDIYTSDYFDRTDPVFINLKDKPEWLLEKSPGGKVPSVELSDGRVIYESLIIADYFDDAFPGVNLHSSDPVIKALDRILVEGWGKVQH